MEKANFMCLECGAIFEEPKVVLADRADLSYGEVFACPDCESDDFVDLTNGD